MGMIKLIKMTTRVFVFGMLIAFLYSCDTNNGINLILKLDNANGIKEGTEVVSHGTKVGKVKKVSLVGSEVHARIILESIKIPRNASFSIKNKDVFGTRFIDISFELENGDLFFKNSDTVNLAEGVFIQESFSNQVIRQIEKIVDSAVVHKSNN